MNIKKMIGEKVILSPLDSREAERLVHWVNDLEVTLDTTLAASNIIDPMDEPFSLPTVQR